MEGERRGDMQSIERPQTGLLNQFLCLTQDKRSHLHKFLIASIFM